ncbi:hypothetical protein TIFTF001_041496 [Ficus carica]|uniref:Uncharacterized protein n=1 Tax=Ficus carica TaxID=3494 RepID=A0AA88D970_FICCA|nr:hypothetical protein TIFTF001_041496 [Ficus carica]
MAWMAGRLWLSTGSPMGAVLSELSDPSRPDVLAWLAVLSDEAPSSTTMTAGGGGAAEARFNSMTNGLSGRVLGPTCKISSNRAAPSLLRLVDVTRPLAVLAASDDDVLVLVPELELPVISALPYRASFSESDTLLIEKRKNFYLLGRSRLCAVFLEVFGSVLSPAIVSSSRQLSASSLLRK